MSTIIRGSIARAPSVVPNTICVLMFRPDMNCLFALNNISLLLTPKSTSILGVVFETREVVVVVKMVVFVSVGSKVLVVVVVVVILVVEVKVVVVVIGDVLVIVVVDVDVAVIEINNCNLFVSFFRLSTRSEMLVRSWSLQLTVSRAALTSSVTLTMAVTL